MRILVDTRLLSRGISSGIGEYTYNLLDAILKRDARDEYLFFYNGFHKVPFPERLSRGNTELVSWRVPNRLFDLSTRFFGEPRPERLLRFDRVFSPHFNIFATRKPRTVTFHDLSFVHHPDFFSRKQRVWHWFQNCRVQAQAAERIIAVSEFTKSDLIEFFGVPGEKIRVIYSGISSDFRCISKDDGSLRAFKEKYRLHAPFILYLGTLEPRKNVSALVRAFSQLKQDRQFKDMKLVIAGGMGWLYDEVIRDIQTSPEKESIRLLGKIGAEERVFLYNLSELFVYPSFFEGFGFPPLEAQACGIPVIASNRTSLPEILADSAVLIDPWRTDELAEAMKKMLDDKEDRQRYRKYGLENVRRFDWDLAAKETISAIKGDE